MVHPLDDIVGLVVSFLVILMVLRMSDLVGLVSGIRRALGGRGLVRVRSQEQSRL
jgi:hypothetical protein